PRSCAGFWGSTCAGWTGAPTSIARKPSLPGTSGATVPHGSSSQRRRPSAPHRHRGAVRRGWPAPPERRSGPAVAAAGPDRRSNEISREAGCRPTSVGAARLCFVRGDVASYPRAAGSATGVGAMPGTDPAQACAEVMGELPDFPYLPELPGRGAGADIIGRTASLLVALPVETTPRGWKFAPHPGRDQRRAVDFLSFDLDAIQQAADGYAGPFKVQVCGPLTLAARIELSRSVNPALTDPGALADLTSSLAEGAAGHPPPVPDRIPGPPLAGQIAAPRRPAGP